MPAAAQNRPLLIFFTSPTNGRCRRAEGFLAQVLQRRHNHETFALRIVEQEVRPDLLDRFRVDKTPTLMVVDNRAFRASSCSRAAATRSTPSWRPGFTEQRPPVQYPPPV